ncbi:centromere protein N isoform X2 [Macrotis lagotis]|uniref:centromere protein N isoform X2 n=1 Tax=Macrotis lagotis TaxID=92651 RepID=UPI003D691949
MDDIVAEFIRRTILKIPVTEIMKILRIWNFLPESLLKTINLRQCKEGVSQEVVELCEKAHANMKEAAILDLIYHQTCQTRKIWIVYKMTKSPGEEVDLFDMEEFKDSFKKVLQRALKNALMTASRYHKIQQMELRSIYLNSLKAIVFKQYNQDFQICCLTPLQERSFETVDPRIKHENIKEKERIQRVTQETFGDCVQPRIEFAQYKLETKFKINSNNSILAEREEPFRCLVKFSSPHLLEALKSLAPAGIADAPLSPLLTCIPHKAMNYFTIRDK